MNDTTDLSREFVQLHMQGQTTQAMEKFQDIMAVKVTDALNSIKPGIAAAFFGADEGEEE